MSSPVDDLFGRIGDIFSALRPGAAGEEGLVDRVREAVHPPIPVESSNLASVRRDRGGRMDIAFRNGSKYRYDDVPDEVFQGLLDAESKGKFFHQNVRKGPYTYNKIRLTDKDRARLKEIAHGPQMQKEAVSTRNLKRIADAIEKGDRKLRVGEMIDMHRGESDETYLREFLEGVHKKKQEAIAEQAEFNYELRNGNTLHDFRDEYGAKAIARLREMRDSNPKLYERARKEKADLVASGNRPRYPTDGEYELVREGRYGGVLGPHDLKRLQGHENRIDQLRDISDRERMVSETAAIRAKGDPVKFFDRDNEHVVARRRKMSSLGLGSPIGFSSGHSKYLFKGIRDIDHFAENVSKPGNPLWFSGHSEVAAGYANGKRGSKVLLLDPNKLPSRPKMTRHLATDPVSDPKRFAEKMKAARKSGKRTAGADTLGDSESYETVIQSDNVLDAIVGEVDPKRGVIPFSTEGLKKRITSSREHEEAKQRLWGIVRGPDMKKEASEDRRRNLTVGAGLAAGGAGAGAYMYSRTRPFVPEQIVLWSQNSNTLRPDHHHAVLGPGLGAEGMQNETFRLQGEHAGGRDALFRKYDIPEGEGNRIATDGSSYSIQVITDERDTANRLKPGVVFVKGSGGKASQEQIDEWSRMAADYVNRTNRPTRIKRGLGLLRKVADHRRVSFSYPNSQTVHCG